MVLPVDEVAPAWSSRLVAELVEADARANATSKSHTDVQVNWKPRPEAWSVGQCLERLWIASEGY
jgi:hypothetical protein